MEQFQFNQYYVEQDQLDPVLGEQCIGRSYDFIKAVRNHSIPQQSIYLRAVPYDFDDGVVFFHNPHHHHPHQEYALQADGYAYSKLGYGEEIIVQRPSTRGISFFTIRRLEEDQISQEP